MQMKNSHDAVRQLISMQIQDFWGVRVVSQKKIEMRANNDDDNSMIFKETTV